MFAAYWIQMTETVQFNFLLKATTFKFRFSNCADICLGTMQMELHYKGELETCVCIKVITWNTRTISTVCIQFLHSGNHYKKCSCEVTLWNCKAAFKGILHYICEGVCLTSWFVYADITSRLLKQNLSNSTVFAFLVEVNSVGKI